MCCFACPGVYVVWARKCNKYRALNTILYHSLMSWSQFCCWYFCLRVLAWLRNVCSVIRAFIYRKFSPNHIYAIYRANFSIYFRVKWTRELFDWWLQCRISIYWSWISWCSQQPEHCMRTTEIKRGTHKMQSIYFNLSEYKWKVNNWFWCCVADSKSIKIDQIIL